MQKKKTPRNKKYLAFIRSLPCCITESEGEVIQAAHVRMGNGGGEGLKPSDYRTVPLHWKKHDEQHQIGEKTFWKRTGSNPDDIIISNLVRYIGDPKRIIEALEQHIERNRNGV